MNRFLKKLKSKAGESLVETLCAIMIFTMASVVLFSLVSAAADINGKAKQKDQENQQNLLAVERGQYAVANGSATVTFTIEVPGTSGNRTEQIAQVPVDVYGGKNGGLYAYFVHADPSGESGG